MDTSKAIFFGLALIALAIFSTDAVRPANAGLMSGGRYMGVDASTRDTRLIWIIDTETSAYTLCNKRNCSLGWKNVPK